MTAQGPNSVIIEFIPVNTDEVFTLGQGREYHKRVNACKKAAAQFQTLRGSVLSKAVVVERRLDSVISSYFCPHYRSRRQQLKTSVAKLAGRVGGELSTEIEHFCFSFASDITDESQILRERMIDIVLGQEGCSFRTKSDILKRIMDAVKTTSPTKKRLDNALEPVMKNRNRFAHRKLGIDWQTQTCSLWNAKSGVWEPVSDKEETAYTAMCTEALDLVDEVAKSIWKMREWVADDAP